ncbi:hypothetical protein RHMOL_Rhmol10G0102700 [Rhododendron molle]|uniref:Uncharacterized protein n=1 Tax=Rhododendron molle TaxID=49168 RepID=A0ACC0M218_RHOML|nr:hypothetical protein RHMOL_Rhmol10G0102700 [Rhododendron molle]
MKLQKLWLEVKRGSLVVQVRASIGLPVIENAKGGVNASKQFGDKLEKRAKRGSVVKKGNGNGVAWCASTRIVNEEDLVDVERAKVGGNLRKQFGSKLERGAIRSYGASLELVGGEWKEIDLDRGVKEIGVKRKRNHFEEGHGVDKGWTKDQEMALQQSWPKVPGRSAKDCFSKLHSDHSTPPQPRPRWRSRKTNSPSYSLLTSTLLKPEEPITEKPSRRKQSRHLAQKTVRQLLQKHNNVNQNYEADLFSVLESTMNPSTQALQKSLTYSTPGGEQKDSGYLKKCRDRSCSAHHAKNMSQLSGSYGATLASAASPPVLKPVKNKALHEKYIDQLHCREAKRRAAKVIRGKENRKDSWINIQKEKTDVVKLQKMLWFLMQKMSSINSIR